MQIITVMWYSTHVYLVSIQLFNTKVIQRYMIYAFAYPPLSYFNTIVYQHMIKLLQRFEVLCVN
jgi:hypothetical protein